MEKEKAVQVGVRLQNSLYKKFLFHLKNLKKQKHPERNQNLWILNAIRNKMERDEASQNIPKAKHLALKLDGVLSDRLEERIEEISKIIPYYTKKQWILEAIEEKLEAEKKIVQKTLSEYCQRLKK